MTARIPDKLLPWHFPKRSLVLCGISRSGTSLLSVLLNSIPDVVCFNETMPKDVNILPRAFAENRMALLTGKPVMNKFDSQGNLTTNTLNKGTLKRKYITRKKLSSQVLIVSKRNIPYLKQIRELLTMGYPVLAMVRHPLYTLISWNSKKAQNASIPGYRILQDDLHPHWEGIPLTATERFDRQAQAWEYCAQAILNCKKSLYIIQYESLILDPRNSLINLCRDFNLTLPSDFGKEITENRNKLSHIKSINEIRHAIEKYCPSAYHLGYGSTDFS